MSKSGVYQKKHQTAPLIKFGKAKIPKFGHSQLAPRVLWTISLSNLRTGVSGSLILFIDRLFSTEAFEKEEGAGAAMGGAMKMELRPTLSLVQTLQIEQRPVLSLEMSGRLAGRPEQRLELSQVIALQHRLLQLSGAELIKFTRQKLEEMGEKRLLQLFNFVIAGKIRRLQPTLTWPEARQIARKLQTPIPNSAFSRKTTRGLSPPRDVEMSRPVPRSILNRLRSIFMLAKNYPFVAHSNLYR